MRENYAISRVINFVETCTQIRGSLEKITELESINILYHIS